MPIHIHTSSYPFFRKDINKFWCFIWHENVDNIFTVVGTHDGKVRLQVLLLMKLTNVRLPHLILICRYIHTCLSMCHLLQYIYICNVCEGAFKCEFCSECAVKWMRSALWHLFVCVIALCGIQSRRYFVNI